MSAPKPKGKNGGARKGAGRKDRLEEAIRYYKKLGELRLPADADEETKALVTECREMLLKIMRKPTRHAQAQIQIAKYLIEECCGKVAEEHNITEHNVSVHIVKSDGKPMPLQLPPPSTAATITLIKPKES